MNLVYNLGMKKLLFLFLLLAALVQAAETGGHTRLPYAKTLALLQGIQKEAIVLGTGKTEVHVFVDPLCPHSRKFIGMVSSSDKMRSKYRYFIYLYSIPRLHSEGVVSAIYASGDPRQTLLKVMVDKETIAPISDPALRSPVGDIAAVAHEIDVYKRPYLFMVKQQ